MLPSLDTFAGQNDIQLIPAIQSIHHSSLMIADDEQVQYVNMIAQTSQCPTSLAIPTDQYSLLVHTTIGTHPDRNELSLE